MDPQFLILGVIWYIVFLFSTTCHEGAHALAAKWGGDPTAFHGGQVSLNPLPHIRREPFGLVLVPIVSYFWMHWMIGWASAPYDPNWQAAHPRRSAWMALAGPGGMPLSANPSHLFTDPDQGQGVVWALTAVGCSPTTVPLEAIRGLIAGSPTKLALTFAILAAGILIMGIWARRGLAAAESAAAT